MAQVQKEQADQQESGVSQEVEFRIASVFAKRKRNGGAVHRQNSDET